MRIRNRFNGFVFSCRIFWGNRQIPKNTDRPRAITRDQSGRLTPGNPQNQNGQSRPCQGQYPDPDFVCPGLFRVNRVFFHKKVMSTGMMVMARTDEAAMAVVLV